ncbi:MAG TPA: hypothetical protein VGQ82_00405 [Chthoniobacterales bacterium]|nr:hypothetical protein [Chthoniobacterales bacterium]
MKSTVAFVLICLGFASGAGVSESDLPTPAVSIPPLNFQHETLPNGLEVE